MLLAALALAADPPAATPAAPPAPTDIPSEPASRPVIRSDAPMLGPPERSLIAAALQPHFAAVSACYQAALARRPTLTGRVKLRMALAAGGHIVDVTITETTLGDPETEACVVGVFVGQRFAGFEDASPFVVHYPFLFQPA